MTCRDMDGVINSRSRDSALSPEAAEHIGRCERCREVMRVLVEGPQIRQPSTSHSLPHDTARTTCPMCSASTGGMM